jgi:hypothetical protein
MSGEHIREVPMAEGETPKIVVDSDWKSQARAEKERLAAAEKSKAAEKAAKAGAQPGDAAGAGAGADEGAEGMPPADFQSLMGTMITQALMYLGGFPDPQTGRAIVSLEHAKFHIDLLAVLQEKTKNNLTPQEGQDLTQALSQLRLRFVEITKAVAQMAAERQAQGKGGAPGMTFGGAPGAGPAMY